MGHEPPCLDRQAVGFVAAPPATEWWEYKYIVMFHKFKTNANIFCPTLANTDIFVIDGVGPDCGAWRWSLAFILTEALRGAIAVLNVWYTMTLGSA